MCAVKKLIFILLFLFLSSCAKKPSGNIQGREIRLAYEKDNYPFTAEDSNGKPIGFEIELMNRIAETEGFSIKFLPKNQSTLAPSVITGTSDMAMGGLLRDEEEERIRFSESYGEVELGLLLSPYIGGEKTEDLEELYSRLRGKTILVKEGSLAAKYLETQREEKGYFLKVVQSNEDFLKQAGEGEAEAIADTLPVLRDLVKNNVFPAEEKRRGKLERRKEYKERSRKDKREEIKEIQGAGDGTEIPIYSMRKKEELCFIVSKGQNKEILRAFDRGFRKLKEEGEYAALCESYGFSFLKTE